MTVCSMRLKVSFPFQLSPLTLTLTRVLAKEVDQLSLSLSLQGTRIEST